RKEKTMSPYYTTAMRLNPKKEIIKNIIETVAKYYKKTYGEDIRARVFICKKYDIGIKRVGKRINLHVGRLGHGDVYAQSFRKAQYMSYWELMEVLREVISEVERRMNKND
ncbi:MAG: hypothetical protein ACTSQE_17030, partial [Candidatus Heimdallarchaeaceae archaeon]